MFLVKFKILDFISYQAKTAKFLNNSFTDNITNLVLSFQVLIKLTKKKKKRDLTMLY